ncbi:hypothetical protein ACTFIW_005219 [Dictyostelium discoideum]|uniref:Probable ethanolamine kinase A n=1 Tax=Dictyostelium discoideum TaxID=44689 RepID=EKIA_DICDI|nr:ethanolamine kinase A [Dictyostelium discoideum AX4]Q869T9.1 RecName: Full=Probable ethanolamine kinase A [Dictyostelium discoideum]EAL70370.1 ethanolamine kinase A [Dictyostelium discoideum AX4]|eukprot:XP_644218.1 ethanolamine kinase A [Dictyostelium discoideum AX4]
MMAKTKGSYEVFHYTVTKDKVNKGLCDIARYFVPEYRNSKDEDLTIQKLNGGITNVLYLVEDKNIEQKYRYLPVVIRLYGYKSEEIIDRKNELIIQTEADQNGLGAKFYGLFDNGCIYGFIKGEPLAYEDISKPTMQTCIAKEIAQWHSIEMPTRKNPSLWPTIKKWAALAPDVYPVPEKNEYYQSINVKKMIEEGKMLEQRLAQLNSPIVFCHNDLLSGNIIYDPSQNCASFIDFEYANYNFRGLELGNHFNEYAGFGPDYSLYPNKESQIHFLTDYHRSLFKTEPTQDELEKLYIESNQFSLASHLYWGFWAIVQAMNSQIDFDYLEYGKARFDRYYETRDQFLNLN